ncbi:katanin p60 ATPase-containing subunit A-like 1-like [Arapaima gigas]
MRIARRDWNRTRGQTWDWEGTGAIVGTVSHPLLLKGPPGDRLPVNEGPKQVLLLSNMNLTEICDNAKRAREYALLGNYDSSLVYYQGVMQQIHKHCQSLRDPALKVKWQQVPFNS